MEKQYQPSENNNNEKENSQKKENMEEEETGEETVQAVKQQYQKIVVNNRNYYIIDSLGVGATSDVFLVTNRTKKNFAIKQIRKVNNVQEELKKSYLQETELLKQINSPFIIKLIDQQELQWNYLLVLEYCDSKSLKNYLEKNAPIEENKAISMFKQILEGMKILQEKDIVHRDLKPENILIHQNFLKIADLGCAKKNIDLKTEIGTHFYMSPEVIRNKEGQTYTPKCDIFSLGVMLFEMTQKDRPYEKHTFYQDDIKIIDEFYQKIQLKQQISEDLERLIRSMIHYDPNQRPSFQELFKHKLFNQQQDDKYDQKNEFELPNIKKKSQGSDISLLDESCVPQLQQQQKDSIQELDNFKIQYEKEQKLKQCINLTNKYYLNEFNIISQTSLIVQQIKFSMPKKNYVTKEYLLYMLLKKVKYDYQNLKTNMEQLCMNEIVQNEYLDIIFDEEMNFTEKIKKSKSYKGIKNMIDNLIESLSCEIIGVYYEIEDNLNKEDIQQKLGNEFNNEKEFQQNSIQVYRKILEEYQKNYRMEFVSYFQDYDQKDKRKALNHLYQVTLNLIIHKKFLKNQLYDFDKIKQENQQKSDTDIFKQIQEMEQQYKNKSL